MRKEIDNWWNQAQRDVRTANNSYTSKDYYASVFWCHQSLEKGLKAFILMKRLAAPEELVTHSLIRLGKISKVPPAFTAFLRSLSPEYYISRYPDASEDVPYSLYDVEDAREILEKTKEVFIWIKANMPRY